MNCEKQIRVERIEEWIALRDVVTRIRHHLFLPWALTAADQRLAGVVVAVLFALDRMSFTTHGVREGDAVRAPFSQQKNQKGRRDEAAKPNFRSKSANKNLHDGISLTTAYYAGKANWFPNFVAAVKIGENDEDTSCSTTRKIELG